uniref:Uncharacterized protein n=1 Tax=Pseudomonas fluorescens (strain SBW25) TaxID=216595 RepID=A0A0G4E4B8_PSEFS|nr:hypothetical protein [Pseudomonas fluorescens]CEK42080.1 hypothetical protein PQBR57_0127 [Pseudomonas fluorescens SBW25]
MNLSAEFDKAANLGVIAKKWFRLVEAQFEDAGITATKKTGLDAAASLLAPAALVAQFIKSEKLPLDRPLLVLVMSDDPVAIMDEGLWIGFAADLAGAAAVELFSTSTFVIHSDHFEPARKLGMPVFESIKAAEAQTRDWDLVVWIHPAIESGESGESAELVAALATKQVPICACMYNELDALIQSHGLSKWGFEFSWMDSQLAGATMNRSSVNKFGIATADVGIEGGWGAVMTRVTPASVQHDEVGWEQIKVAMGLYRLEGSTSGSWGFGSVLPGVSFNQYKPVGLIGNIAVDPKTGLLLAECSTTKVLNLAGHLWGAMLISMPSARFDLVPWAARVKLVFNAHMTKEDKRRGECIELLNNAFDAGMVEAGIALARGYERIGTAKAKEKAGQLYRRIGAGHPMSAYFLAHSALEAGLEDDFWTLIRSAASAEYPPAITDYGIALKDSGDYIEAGKMFIKSMQAGDAEAAFRFGEMMIKAGEYGEALKALRAAWTKNHAEAANTAHWLCTEMINHRLGKHGEVMRELKDIKFAIQKRTRLTNQLERDGA